MAITNHERVGKALEYLNAGLLPFIEREMTLVYGDDWENISVKAFPEDHPGRGEKGQWDTQKILLVMWDQWNSVFNKTLGHAERSIVSELRETRKNWAHQQTFSGNDTYRALDSVERLLTAVSAPQAADVEKMRNELLRTQFEDKRRVEMRKASYQPTEGKPQGDLPPWRTVVTPHPDVASGRYQQAEFAADLWQVYLKEGSDEYKDPVEFYQRTFLTEGLRTLLTKSLLRLSINEGDPVVELQTNFGGGKTHSMLALYHLFSGAKPGSLPGIEELLNDTSVTFPKKVNRVVIVGTKISPGQPSKKPDGTIVRTLWGEIAWQLGGKKAFKMVKEDDEKGTNPGDTLRELFNAYSPCLILIDEWVAYARQLRDDSSLPGGTFDTQFTFAQALSEAAKAAKNTMLVVSVPSSDNEIGGDWGKKALERLKNAIGRVESPWKPASQDEGFEIVRRRLFQPLTDSQAVQRDAVAHSCSELYKTQSQEFPSECREASYERRIKMAYPIHPEMFDRLYNDWSTLDKFQRTRGILRLMAAVIHSLWERQDANLLIMPATIPIDDPSVQFELTRYLEDQWVPVIERDVDGPHSLPLEIDSENSNLGRYSACRRVSRTIYLGSAPTTKVANRGIDDKRVKLGCVQPGESVATFGDALRRLTDRATYLYVDGTRYWYSTQPSVTRLAEDRASQLSADDVSEEIQRRLKEQTQPRNRGDFVKVHSCTSSSDVPDERDARLVILAPEFAHTAKEPGSPARKQAEEILASRGSSPRTYKNTLVFLAADTTRLQELNHAVKSFLAWKSIREQRVALNLDPFQTKQAETKCKGADETVDIRIPETYQWLLVPQQPDPKKDIEWVEIRQQGQDLAPRASKKLRNDEMLLVTLGGERLRHEIDKVPLWRGNHVAVRQLIEDFATYLYLPRLKNEEVLFSAIRNGVNILTWQTETFAYSAGWDDEKKRYQSINPSTQSYNFDSVKSLIVKPDIAAAQIEQERTKSEGAGGSATQVIPTQPGAVWEGGGTLTGKTSTGKTDAGPEYRRFHGSVKVDPIRIGRDTNKIADEVVQHFNALKDADIEVTLEISVKLPSGVTEKTVRDVTENCRTLKFDNFGFEGE